MTCKFFSFPGCWKKGSGPEERFGLSQAETRRWRNRKWRFGEKLERSPGKSAAQESGARVDPVSEEKMGVAGKAENANKVIRTKKVNQFSNYVLC